MKVNVDRKKNVEVVAGIIQKTTDVSKKVVVSVQNSAKDIADKKKSDSYLRKLKKYNPLFPAHYLSENFHIPNMIVIVDDAVRRGMVLLAG